MVQVIGGDSGLSIVVHLVNDLPLLHDPVMHSQPLPLHLATSDAKGGILASVSVCLLNCDKVPFWLHNVQCVPSATTNMISVSSAIRDGASFLTDPMGGDSRMLGQNGWSGSVVGEQGPYVIGILDDCTAESGDAG